MDDGGSMVYQYMAAASANLAAFVAGISLAWSSPGIPKLIGNGSASQALTEIFPEEKNFTEEEISWIVTFLSVGALIGVLAACAAIAQYGRKNTLLLGGLPLLVTSALSTLGNNVAFLYLLRLINGIGVGMILTVLPIYIGEIAQDDCRATLGCLTQLFLSLGYAYAFINVPAMDILWYAVITSLPTLLFIMVFMVVGVESPFYLMELSELQCRKALQRLRGKVNVMNEFMSIKMFVEISRRRRQLSCVEIFETKHLRKSILITTGLAVFQQLCGCTVCIFFMSFIIQEFGCAMDLNVASALVAMTQVIICAVFVYYVKHVEYRTLLIISLSILGFSHFFLALMLYATHFEWPSLFIFCVIIMCNASGLCNIVFLISSEIFRYDVKIFGNSFAASMYWIFGFLTTVTFLPFSRTFGMYSTFFAFSFMCLLASVFILYLVPDLNNRTLRDIQVIVANWRNNRVFTENNRLFYNRHDNRQGARVRVQDNGRNNAGPNLNENTGDENDISINANSVAERRISRTNVEEDSLQRSGNVEDIDTTIMSLGDFERIWNSEDSGVPNRENLINNMLGEINSQNTSNIQTENPSLQHILPGLSTTTASSGSDPQSKTSVALTKSQSTWNDDSILKTASKSSTNKVSVNDTNVSERLSKSRLESTLSSNEINSETLKLSGLHSSKSKVQNVSNTQIVSSSMENDQLGSPTSASKNEADLSSDKKIQDNVTEDESVGN